MHQCCFYHHLLQQCRSNKMCTPQLCIFVIKMPSSCRWLSSNLYKVLVFCLRNVCRSRSALCMRAKLRTCTCKFYYVCLFLLFFTSYKILFAYWQDPGHNLPHKTTSYHSPTILKGEYIGIPIIASTPTCVFGLHYIACVFALSFLVCFSSSSTVEAARTRSIVNVLFI